MQNISWILQIFGLCVAGVVILACIGCYVWIKASAWIRGVKHDDEDERVRPYKLAADGYKLDVERLEREVSRLRSELKSTSDERDSLRGRVKELEELTLGQAATLLRQQGELDRLKRQVEDLGDLRSQLNDVLAQIKNSAR
jgi:chromosome segregation ATPase